MSRALYWVMERGRAGAEHSRVAGSSLSPRRRCHGATCLPLQAARPRAIVDLIRSAEQFRVPGSSSGGSAGGTTSRKAAASPPQAGSCERCGYISSQVCAASSHNMQFPFAFPMCMQQCLVVGAQSKGTA